MAEASARKAPAAGPKPRDLSRHKVVAASLALIYKAGADALTMRAVADKLGVTPMALYNHFSNKRALLAAVADSIVATARFDGGDGDWRDRILHCFTVLRELCLRHPGLPRLLEIESAAPASVFAPMDITLRALEEAGLDDLDSARTYFLLVGFTLTQAAYQTRPVPDLEPSRKIRAERIAGQGYKAVEHLDLPGTWDFDAAFAFGMSVILTGVEAIVSKSPAAA